MSVVTSCRIPNQVEDRPDPASRRHILRNVSGFPFGFAQDGEPVEPRVSHNISLLARNDSFFELRHNLQCGRIKVLTPPVLHTHTPIHLDDGPGHIRPLEGQKADHLCDLMGLSWTAHGYALHLELESFPVTK